MRRLRTYSIRKTAFAEIRAGSQRFDFLAFFFFLAASW